jgi:hypothetical protein
VKPKEFFWPLTGKKAPDEASTRQRVLSVKIENSQAARPQTGLNSADVVYETLAEGGITRFNAIYHSNAAENLGPVRSARISDVYIVPQYHAVFAFSGSSSATERRLEDADLEMLDEATHPNAFERVSDRPMPHNVYTSVDRLRGAADDAGYDSEADPPALAFGEAPESGATTTTAVAIPFHPSTQVSWSWNRDKKAWTREMDGEPHVDTTSKGPYAAQNVVVIFAEMTETGSRDSAGAPVFDIALVGSGDAILMRGGKRYDCRWAAGEDQPPRLETAEGDEVLLATGKTWFEVVPPDLDVRTSD